MVTWIKRQHVNSKNANAGTTINGMYQNTAIYLQSGRRCRNRNPLRPSTLSRKTEHRYYYVYHCVPAKNTVWLTAEKQVGFHANIYKFGFKSYSFGFESFEAIPVMFNGIRDLLHFNEFKLKTFHLKATSNAVSTVVFSLNH